jgi:predicted site-specific integrase-resolvase
MNAHVRPPKIEPFALKAETAAGALDVSLSTFLTWVKDGKMPKPIKVGGVALYDTESVRNAWRALKEAGGGDDANELD